MKKKEKINLSAICPDTGTRDVYGIFSGTDRYQPYTVLYGLEYEPAFYTGVCRGGKLCGTLTGSRISKIHRKYVSICFCHNDPEDRNRFYPGAGACKKGGGKRDSQNHLLCTLCNQYYGSWCAV